MISKKKKAALVAKILDEYFPSPEVPLDYTSPYTLLITVLLSAQTTDKCVNKITKDLFKKASTPGEMIKLSIDTIEKIVKPCGLGPSKAKAIYNLSNILVEKHQSQVPCTFALLEELPGVGHKTASVVMATAFNKPAFAIDTHIKRSAKRWGLSDGKNVEKVEKDLKKLFPKDQWKKLHLQMILFAREFCPAKCHEIDTCPICKVLKEEKQ